MVQSQGSEESEECLSPEGRGQKSWQALKKEFANTG